MLLSIYDLEFVVRSKPKRNTLLSAAMTTFRFPR